MDDFKGAEPAIDDESASREIAVDIGSVVALDDDDGIDDDEFVD